MEENKKKTGLIIALLVIIVALIVLLFFVMNKKTNVNVINNSDNTNPAKNGETLPPNENPTIDNNTNTGNETTEQNQTNQGGQTSRLDESGVKKLQATLTSNISGGYGLYFGKPNSKITIDDVNNPYLLAFNLKKYLSEKLNVTTEDGMEYIEWMDEDSQTWKWDNCLNKDCDLELQKLYRVNKKEFNDYMHTTYNTTNNYDLKKADEAKTKNIIESAVVVDSGSDYFNILRYPTGGSINEVKTELVKYEEDDNYLYIYDKFIDCIYGEGYNACYYDVVPSPNEQNPIFEHNDVDTPAKIADEFKEEVNSLYTFKHTFKKVNGNYYWVSSENYKSSNY